MLHVKTQILFMNLSYWMSVYHFPRQRSDVGNNSKHTATQKSERDMMSYERASYQSKTTSFHSNRIKNFIKPDLGCGDFNTPTKKNVPKCFCLS